MARSYQQIASCSPSNQPDSYIYSIVPLVNGGVAAVTSADEILVVDGRALQTTRVLCFDGSPKGITSLVTNDHGQSIICAGSDGFVTTFDVRDRRKTAAFKLDKGVTALASRGHCIAVGTELARQSAVISIWDLRQNMMCWQNAENNDDTTALDFHPVKNNILLGGGDDGLVSIFDTSVAEEDDSLIQAFNHGPIHKAGFFGDSAIYALSSDQNMALHPIYEEQREEEPKPHLLGDLRPIVPCEYVIDVFRSGGDMVLAAGSHSESRVDLVTIHSSGSLDLENRIIMEGAHGGEIVRSVFAEETARLLSSKILKLANIPQTGSIFTAGEDGQIKVFRPSGEANIPVATPKGSNATKRSETRFKPY